MTCNPIGNPKPDSVLSSCVNKKNDDRRCFILHNGASLIFAFAIPELIALYAK